jgi:Flp pilus assembly protein TadG
MRTLSRFISDETGASAAEFALAFIPFSALVFGIIALSMVLYANQTLQFATEAAARYYSVTTANNSGTPPLNSAVNAYGQRQYTGPMAPTFTASRGGCGLNGFQVYGTGTIPLDTGVYNTTLTLRAHACFP